MLTVLTQIGGVIPLIAWLLAFRLVFLHGRARMAAVAAIFVVLHVIASETVVPLAASHIADRVRLHRVRLPCGWARPAMLWPASAIICLANRNYVTGRADHLAMALAMDARAGDSASRILYLDAGFPFFDGWPLLPRSPIGCGAFEQPGAGRAASCPDGDWPDLPWNLGWLQPLFPDHVVDRERTAAMQRWLVEPGRQYGVRRVLVEPHLEATLGVASDMLRFQGCHAARTTITFMSMSTIEPDAPAFVRRTRPGIG
jgi:hypothetical protein